MDPLSIPCSVVCFIGVCRKTSQQLRLLRDLRRAPDSIAHVCDEIDNLQHVLAAVRIAFAKRHDDHITGTWLPVFKSVELILDELSSICDEAAFNVDNAANARRNFLARYRWLADKHRVEEIRTRLRTARLDLANQLAATSLNDILELNGGVRHLIDVLSDWRTVQSSHRLEHYPPDPSGSRSILPQPSKPSRDSKMQPSPYLEASTTMSDAVTVHKPVPDALRCMSKCSCACHQISRFKSPTYLSYYFGSLLVKSNGIPGLKWACDEAKCKRRQQSTVHISYRFPEWLLNRMISSMILSDQMNGPQCSLISPRLVSNECDLFYYAKTGDIKGIQKLFSNRVASPFDVSVRFNYTALHYAIDAAQTDAARFLLQNGAHIDVSAANEETPADLAWNKICTGSIPTAKSEVFACMFEKDTWLEDRHLCTIHKIILDLLPTARDLSSELDVSAKDINATDTFKRTPLSWAAEIGHEHDIHALLTHGADTEITSVAGLTPLHYAAQGGRINCLRALLSHGANVHARNEWSQHALNIACFFHDDPELAAVLLDAGADINEQDMYESSALSCAAFTNRPNMAKYLLHRGANINNERSEICNPLDEAVHSNSHECISLLLREGASLTRKNIFGNTILHTLAARGDLWSWELFANHADLSILDASLPDCNEKTARTSLEERGDEISPYHWELFERIVAHPERVREEADEQEQFYDVIGDLPPPTRVLVGEAVGA